MAAARASAARAADGLLLAAAKSGRARGHAEPNLAPLHDTAVASAASLTKPQAVSAKNTASREGTRAGGMEDASVDSSAQVPVSEGLPVEGPADVPDKASVGQQVLVGGGLPVKLPVAVLTANAQLSVSRELQADVLTPRAAPLRQQLPVSNGTLRIGNFMLPPSPRSLAVEVPLLGGNTNPPPSGGGSDADDSEVTAVVPDTQQVCTVFCTRYFVGICCDNSACNCMKAFPPPLLSCSLHFNVVPLDQFLEKEKVVESLETSTNPNCSL